MRARKTCSEIHRFNSVPFRTNSSRAADTFHLRMGNETIIAGASEYSVSHFIDCPPVSLTLAASLIASRNAADHTGKNKGMNTLDSTTRSRIRKLGATLFRTALGLAMAASAMAADTVTLRVGDQKGGNRSLLEIAGLAKDLPYKIEWSEFPAAAPILEALNAGTMSVTPAICLSSPSMPPARRSRRSAARAPMRGRRRSWFDRIRRSFLTWSGLFRGWHFSTKRSGLLESEHSAPAAMSVRYPR